MTSEEYSRHAQYCHLRAASTRDPEERLHWLEMAESWTILAEEAPSRAPALARTAAR
jgi:hypothetical protein